jgi:hypothetical protein
MGWVVLIIVLAIVLGVVGFVVEALLWLVAIAAVLLLVGVVMGFLRGRRPTGS